MVALEHGDAQPLLGERVETVDPAGPPPITATSTSAGTPPLVIAAESMA